MARVELGAVLDLRAAVPLYAELSALKEVDVVVDASRVERIGGLCLQVLLAAQRSWKSGGRAWSIADPSAAFFEGVTLMACKELLSCETA